MSKHLGVEYKVRMPQELKDKIADSAKELNRSMNQDIVARLEKSFAPIDLDEIEKQLNDYYYSNDLILATPIRLPRINKELKKSDIDQSGFDNLRSIIKKTKDINKSLNEYLPHANLQNAAFHEQDKYLAVRGSHGNTTENCINLIEYIKRPECIQVLLFATHNKPTPGFSREDGPETNLPLMGAILLVELEDFNAYVIFDGLFLTAQRYPRYKEVKEVLDAAVISDKAYFINIPVPFTSTWGPVGAVDQLLPLPRQELTPDSRKNFFKLLCNISEEKYLDMYRS